MIWPEYNVTRLPFNECAPSTEEGIRRLAYIAIAEGHPNLLDFMDGLELLMLAAKRIKPESAPYDNVRPIGIRA